VLCHGGQIEIEHLPPYLRGKSAHQVLGRKGGMNMRAIEKVLITETLRKHEGNRALAAKDLGIDTSTLYRKIRRLKIEAPKKDGRSRKSRSDVQ
jgi:transcriptional regulator of acetoin/glycerol metabolism